MFFIHKDPPPKWKFFDLSKQYIIPYDFAKAFTYYSFIQGIFFLYKQNLHTFYRVLKICFDQMTSEQFALNMVYNKIIPKQKNRPHWGDF